MGIVINSNTGEIDVAASTPGTYRITYTTNGDCPNSSTQDITINALPTISITASSTSICAGDSVTLTASGAGAGGSYSWSDGQTTAAITVTPGATITYSVTGTDANGCFNTASQQITVTAVDTATVVYDSNSYCQLPTGALAVEGYYPLYTTESASNAESSDGTSHTHVLSGTTYYMPNAGIVMYHGTYSLTATPTITGASGTFNSPTGLSINTTTGVIDKNASTPGTYSVVYTTSGSCSITVTNSITITALDNATFAYGSSAYCDNVSDPTPTKSATGTFSSSTGLSINTSTGEVDLDASTAGTYVIGFVTNGSCPNSSIQTLTINAAPAVAISGTLSYCAGSNTTLTATAGLSSYLWSSGETTQSITATAGSYTVTGTDANGCSTTSSSVTVTETPLDNAGFSYSSSSYQPTDPDPTPTITGLTGGTFSAGSGLVFVDSGTNTGSSTGQIDLSASTATSYTITYNTSSSGSSVCPNTSTQTVEIGAPVEQIANAEAMSFNGTDAYMLAETSALSGVSEFSISVWIKSNNVGTGSSRSILSATQGSTSGTVILDAFQGQDILAHVGNTATYNRYNGIISEGVWTHLVMVYDGSESTAGSRIKLYKNGNLQTRTSASGSIPATSPSVTSSTYIGTWALNPGSSALFDGEMDEVAIFNTALSASKIQEIYNATAVVDGVPQTANLFTGGLSSSLVYWNRMGDS